MATKTQAVLFTAESADLILTREATGETINSLGNRQPTRPPLQYEFKRNNLLVDDALEEKTRRYYEQHADALDLQHADKSALEWLREYARTGVNRIFEIQPVAPDPGDTLAQVALASADRDEEKLASLYEEEQEGWKRPIVLQTIEATLKAFEGEKATK